MKHVLSLAIAVILGAGVAAPPAHASHRKPITKKFTATAAVPDPTNLGPNARYTVCEGTVAQSQYTEMFKAPDAGKLKVDINDFYGDWDLLLIDSKGKQVAAGVEIDTGTPAQPGDTTMTGKLKKGETYKIIACNWAGGPNAKGTYTFTFAT